MRQIVFALVLIAIGVKAQTLADASLESFVRQALVDGIKVYGDDVNAAGVVVMEANSGNVVCNVNIGHFRGEIKDIPNGNEESVPSGIGRAALYLSMMGTLSPDFVVDTDDGLYTDSITGCSIVDSNHSRGGYGRLTLKKAFDMSDVGIIKAVETAFNRDMGRYGAAIRKTGVFFANKDEYDYYETDSWNPWIPCDILGYRSPYSLLQQTAWVNMVANGGYLKLRMDKKDSTQPICEVKDKAGLDSLRSAMFEAVEHGTGIKMRSLKTYVAGLVNVSPADHINCRACFAAAFWPYQSPQYTIGVWVNKHDKPAGRNIASKIAGNIIEYMINQYLHLRYVDGFFSD